MHPRISKLDKIRVFGDATEDLTAWRVQYFDNRQLNSFLSFTEFPFSHGLFELVLPLRVITLEYQVVGATSFNIALWHDGYDVPLSRATVSFFPATKGASVLSSVKIDMMPTLLSLKDNLIFHASIHSYSAPVNTVPNFMGFLAYLVIDACVYMSYYREDRVALPRQIEVAAPRRNARSPHKKPIKVGVYYINKASIGAASVPIVRHTESWTVRGHMRRNPKTGERNVFVKAYVKGPKRNEIKPDPQVYHIKMDHLD